MRHFFKVLTLALVSSIIANADDSVIVLDLTKSTTELTFNAENGSWTETYNDDVESIESQCFSFSHNAIQDWNTWWNFTASDSHNNARPENTLNFQWSNMAEGGIELDEEGNVKLNDFGAPVVNPEIPYLVAYAAGFMGPHPANITFNDGKTYEPIGMYVNLNSYAYYSIVYGDSFARAFTNGDKFTLIAHGVAPDETEKTVETGLASYTNGDLTINRGWKYVDLSGLGEVNELYFTMESTDSGVNGINTPLYFCLDKLSVKPTETTSIENISALTAGISYDRASLTVNITNAEFAGVYDCTGKLVFSTDSNSFSVSSLDSGVYIVRAGNSSVKIAR